MPCPRSTTPSFFGLTGLDRRLAGTVADLRDRAALASAYAAARPDMVIHLAAQPLVAVGYTNPAETFETNVMGTVNLLDCVRERGAGAVVVMTSDKVYRGSAADNRENDRLGADDPYGGSKVCCEVVAEVYARSFLAKAGVSARHRSRRQRRRRRRLGRSSADPRCGAGVQRRPAAGRCGVPPRCGRGSTCSMRSSGLLLVAQHTAASLGRPGSLEYRSADRPDDDGRRGRGTRRLSLGQRAPASSTTAFRRSRKPNC